MGAGTYTGIEAVSNGIPILRDPKVRTAKRTITYMAISLAITAGGLMIAYFLHHTTAVYEGKTLVKSANAVLLDSITKSWGGAAVVFILVTLISEAAILVVAAQTGFIDGPRVLANMALDLMAARPTGRPERPPGNRLRHRPHGRGGADRHGGQQGQRRYADRALQHQRVHHVPPVADGNGPPLVGRPPRSASTGTRNWPSTGWAWS